MTDIGLETTTRAAFPAHAPIGTPHESRAVLSRPGAALLKNGLAHWQMRVAIRQIEDDLEARLSLASLASRVRLSPSHFSRAFKHSFGISPHAYVVLRRVERAKSMMLETAEALSQISTACGFSDQSHLSRVFLRHVGHSPNAWRRARTLARSPSP